MNVNPARAMQVSWIDAAQLSALADTLRPRPANQASEVTEPLGDSDFTAATSQPMALTELQITEAPDDTPPPETQPPPAHQPLDEIRTKLKAIRERALQAGLIRQNAAKAALSASPAETPQADFSPIVPEAAPEEAPSATELLPPLPMVCGDVGQRISLFADWAQPALGRGDLFIVDDQGLLLWGPPNRSSIVLSAIMAREATSRMSAQTACDTAAPSRQILASSSHLILLPCATRLGIMHIAILGPQPVAEIYLPTLSQALIQMIDI